MKIALFGATGNTGLQLATQALQRGHQVTALVRDPSKLDLLTSKNENLKVVKCDILNSEELSQHLQGHECVISALGVAGIQFFKVSFYLNSMESIITAMRKTNIKRLLCVTSFYSQPDPNYPTVYKLVLRPMIGRQLDNMLEMEHFLFNKCSDIDFTIVRPPRLLDSPLENVEVKINENAFYFPDYSTKNQIPRANVAKFMLDALENNLYFKQGVAIDLPK